LEFEHLQIIKGPVTKYFPPNCKRVAFSHSAPDVVPLRQFVEELSDDTPAVFAVGAMAHGKIDAAYADKWVSISEYPLSAACCLGKITNALEWKWGIL
jgi:rRNA small subunit pseudouridine methyltransferase Nep1